MAKNNNKCRVCGYKFKKGDSLICPECLTSREETATCDDFSSELHSHTKVDTSFRSYSELPKSDAQKELERERKEESDLQWKFYSEQKKTASGVPYSSLSETQRQKLEAYYSAQNASSKSDAQKQLEQERQQSYQQQTTTTTQQKTFVKIPPNSRLTETQRQKLEAYYNAQHGSSTQTTQTTRSYTGGQFPGNATYTSTRTRSSGGAKGTSSPGKTFATVIAIIVILNVVTGILGAVFIGSGSNSSRNNSKSDFSYNLNISDYSFDKDKFSSHTYSEEVQLGDPIYIGSGEIVVGSPEVANLDPADIDMYSSYESDIEGAEDYDGVWFLVGIPVKVTNTGDNSYLSYFDSKLVNSIYDDYSDIYSYNLENTSNIVGSGETEVFYMVFAVPECDEQNLVLTFLNGLDTYEYTYALPKTDYEALKLERQGSSSNE